MQNDLAPTIYNYHPDTGEYIGTAKADPSPAEPGEFLFPAHSTTIAPPTEPAIGFALVFDGTEWGDVEDHRGETWWSADGAEIKVDQLGNPVDRGLTKDRPETAPPPVTEHPAPVEPRLRYAIVLYGVFGYSLGRVVQVVEMDRLTKFFCAEGYALIEDPDGAAQVGMSYDGNSFGPAEEFVEPPPNNPPE